MPLKAFGKRMNSIICDDGGILLGSCKSSLDGNKNYLLMFLVATLFQYVLPAMNLFVIIPAFIGHSISVGFIDFLQLINPLFILLYIPLTFVDAVIVALLLVVNCAVIIIYWSIMTKTIGSFAFIPLAVWTGSLLLFFIPFIGPVLSIIIGIFPWMLMFIFFHWYVYSTSSW